MSKYPTASHEELASREVTKYGIAKIDAVDALAQKHNVLLLLLLL